MTTREKPMSRNHGPDDSAPVRLAPIGGLMFADVTSAGEAIVQILVVATTSERGRSAVRSAAAQAARERACLTLAICACAPARPWWQHLSWVRGDVPELWEAEPITDFTWRDMVALVPDDVSLTVWEMSDAVVAAARRLTRIANYDHIIVEQR